MEKKRERKREVKTEFGLGGLLKGIGSFIDILADLAEKGEGEIKREGELGGEKEGYKAVYGFSVRLGAGGPRVESFGNVRQDREKGPIVEEVREPMVDLFDEGAVVVMVAELPGVNEGDITLEVKDDILTLSAQSDRRKYYKEVLLPSAVISDSMTHSYRNGILEVRLRKVKG